MSLNPFPSPFFSIAFLRLQSGSMFGSFGRRTDKLLSRLVVTFPSVHSRRGEQSLLCLTCSHQHEKIVGSTSLREAIEKKKNGLPMDFFRKVSAPPPYFQKLWNPRGTFEFWSLKKGKTLLAKNTQNGYIKEFFFRKVPSSVQNPLF